MKKTNSILLFILISIILIGCPEPHQQMISVNYHGNDHTGGSVPTDQNRYAAGDQVTVLDNSGTLVKTGYSFINWNTRSDGSGESLNPGDTFNISSINKDLYAQWLAEPGIRSVSGGHGFALFIKDDGSLWGKGANGMGQLGNGNPEPQTDVLQIMPGTRFKSVSAGKGFSMAIDEDGNLYASGQNDQYQLGTGDTTNRSSYTLVRTGVRFVDCGYTHSLIIDTDNKLYGIGHGSIDGALGLGTTYQVSDFTLIDTDVTSASAGERHSLYIKNGSLWAMGSNSYGELFKGTRSSTPEKTPIAAAPGISGIRSVSAGMTHSLLITENDELYVVGSQLYGELGNGNAHYLNTPDGVGESNASISKLLDGVKEAEAGSYVTMILKQNGTLWAVGSDYNGQQGDGNASTSANLSLTQVLSGVHTFSQGDYFTSVWKTDNTFWETKENGQGDSIYQELLFPAKRIE